MRLLLCNDTGDFSLTEDLMENEIPPYAILSHTWLADTEEPTFEDLTNGKGKEKLGYEKIRFCGEQTRRDGLKHFWVDTCCINKANYTELSRSINYMFRWYCNATRCYVYLSDVWTTKRKASDGLAEFTWESAFRASKWFSRGWTLQELLAPAEVKFFSKEGKLLGDKKSLEQQIYDITGIPKSALQGARLSQFHVNERYMWMERRQTKLAEDKVYALLGIFDVEIPLFYDEGAVNAFKRLQEVIDKREICTRDLRLTDPRDDKKRIEGTKGGLLEDSYRWILEDSEFKRWHNDPQNTLLWIKGDPGKGKTMLLCGVINELGKSMPKTGLLSYFFCQATDSRTNHATAVLRSLMYMVVHQQPSLILYILKKYDHAGKSLFDDENAWVALVEIFTDMLQDLNLNRTFLIIDALDECVTDRPKLLNFIIQSSTSSHVKWIVSSRNWPDIEERLKNAGQCLSLELNAKSISTAVKAFIHDKVLRLAQQKSYNNEIRHAVFDYLSSNANDTFLWVALVCQNLEGVRRRDTLEKLDAFPPGLDSLYQRMMEQIWKSDEAVLCNQILALMLTVYRPISLKELTSLVETLEDVSDDSESLREDIELCGSFLTIREGAVYFVHQSANDYLLVNASSRIFPRGMKEQHYSIFSRSLDILSSTLRRDMYNLRAPGFPIEEAKPPDSDPLARASYACVYWADHLDASKRGLEHDDLQDGGTIHRFLNKRYLHWLEALSLLGSISKGILAISRLEAILGTVDTQLARLARDARRFILAHRSAIEQAPLQTFSVLVFSPRNSVVRQTFKAEEPAWIRCKPQVENEWDACISTLEGHKGWVTSVAWSPDTVLLASSSRDKAIKIWNTKTGCCISTLEGHKGWVTSVAWSPDTVLLASSSDDKAIKIWNTKTGCYISTLEGHKDSVTSVAWSPDTVLLASSSHDDTIKIWDTKTGCCISTLEGHKDWVISVAWSPDTALLASGSYDETIKIWNTKTGCCISTLEGHKRSVTSVAWSSDTVLLASSSRDKTIKIWDTKTGCCISTLDTGQTIYSLQFDLVDSSLLHTSIGIFYLQPVAMSAATASTVMTILQPRPSSHRSLTDTRVGYGLTRDSTWITYRGRNMLWLPPEFRPSSSAVSGSAVGLGCTSGRVLVFVFAEEPPWLGNG